MKKTQCLYKLEKHKKVAELNDKVIVIKQLVEESACTGGKRLVESVVELVEDVCNLVDERLLEDIKKNNVSTKEELMNQWLMSLITALLGSLKPQMLKDVIDKVLDFIEDKVVASDNKIDDMVVLPLCKLIREALNIPDD